MVFRSRGRILSKFGLDCIVFSGVCLTRMLYIYFSCVYVKLVVIMGVFMGLDLQSLKVTVVYLIAGLLYVFSV